MISLLGISERPFDLLEKVVEHWNDNLEGINKQVLFESYKEAKDEIWGLYNRHYVVESRVRGIIPTLKLAEIYVTMDKNKGLKAPCLLPD